MADRASNAREVVEQLLLAVVGAASFTAERADALADALAERGGLRRDEARELVEEVTGRWRGERERLSERTAVTLQSFFRDLGLVTRGEYEDLELRVAQLEHRLRLVEGGTDRPPPPPLH